MANVFEKRATEYIRDGDVFLALITPEPLKTFFEGPASEERLYDRLAVVIGTPGSGKTTIAMLMQFQLVDALRRNQTRAGYKELLSALTACRAVDEDGRPRVAGVRLPLEAEYRDFWELPYAPSTRTRLLLALIQARAVLGWLRNFQSAGPYRPVRIVARAGSDAAAGEMGGLDLQAVRARAEEVERAVYSIGAALVPPASEENFPTAARTAYRPFDVIEAFELEEPGGGFRVQPLVILDDAHTLHHEQLAALNRDLARRELRIARWVLTRLDVLSPPEALYTSPSAAKETTALQLDRDVTEIAMQKGRNRADERRAFRRMARDMADRYLGQMTEFASRGHDKLADLLATEPEAIHGPTLQKLEKDVDRVAKSLGITTARKRAFEAEIERYVAGATGRDHGVDVQLGMLRIMMHRYANRVPQGELFDVGDPEPSRPVKADSAIAEGARVHLHSEFGRPLYYGIETLCDASSENAEQFLRLAGKLVSRAETRILRRRGVLLESKLQHSDLVEQANAILDGNFPFAHEVRQLVYAMAALCRARSLEPNASLGGGASAIGVPQHEFNEVTASFPRLARVLQFAVGYNVLLLTQNYGQGGKNWCLLDLGGCVLMKHGLTLKRGGFLERRVADLDALLVAEDS